VATDLPPDPELIARTLAGDRGAFEALVRRHYRAAFSIALAHSPTRADAEDVCHDAFLRAAAKLRDCRDRSRFAYWLCAIVRNHARNVATRGGGHRTESLEHETAQSGHDPGRDVEVRDLRRRLFEALAILSPVQREVVLLHDLDGWTHEAIARLIGTSAGMSRQHLFNARRTLRETLGQNTSREYFS
jgi:RNA polymerase sigma-70 factor, ECF subfamily